MNATDLVITPSGRLFSRTSPRATRSERPVAAARSPVPAELANTVAAPVRRQRAADTVACACGLASETIQAHVYNEEAFQYFLSIERLRIEAAGQHVLLALVDLKRASDPVERADGDLVQKLFHALRASLRETDIVGWYREKDVVGAVLPQFGGSRVSASTRRVGQRLCQGLAERLPATLARRLEVHVYQVPPVDQN